MSKSELWISVVDESLDCLEPFHRLGSTYPDLVAQWDRLERCVDDMPSSLLPYERLAAALTTSVINGSSHHVRKYRKRLEVCGAPSWLADALIAAPSWPIVDDDRVAVIAVFAAALTTNPAALAEENVRRLRDVDLTDVDVLDLVNIVGYNNYVNRLALALGLR